MTIKLPSSFANLLRSIKSAIVQEVPSDSATCEFDCHRETCSGKRWQGCEKRRHSTPPVE